MKVYNTFYKRKALRVRATGAKQAREIVARLVHAQPDDIIAILCAVDERPLAA